nr:serine protease 7-like [Drosophila takahashii]
MLGRLVVISFLLFSLAIEVQLEKLEEPECGFFDEVQMVAPEAIPSEHQWVVRIVVVDKGALDNTCLGVLVSKRTVLAPAHCFVKFNRDAKAFSVHLGVHNKSAPVGVPFCFSNGYCVRPAQEIRLSEVAVHPEFDPKTLQNNLAVLTLQQDAKLGQNVMPICMPPPQLANETLVGQTFVVAGLSYWKDLKQKTWVTTHSRSFCQSRNNKLLTGSNTLCGYHTRAEGFYYGAPLVGMQVKGHVTQNYYLVGFQIDIKWDNKRMLASFLAIRNYLDFIHKNSDSLIVRP